MKSFLLGKMKNIIVFMMLQIHVLVSALTCQTLSSTWENSGCCNSNLTKEILISEQILLENALEINNTYAITCQDVQITYEVASCCAPEKLLTTSAISGLHAAMTELGTPSSPPSASPSTSP